MKRQTRELLDSCFHDGGNLPGVTMRLIVDLPRVPIAVGVHLALNIAARETVGLKAWHEQA